MPKSEDSKIRLLYIADILVKECFGRETISAKIIQEELEEEYEISCDIKSIRSDIDVLIDFGYEIEKVHGRGYRLLSRPDGLTLDDLVKLRDCIHLANSLPKNEQKALLDKLGANSIHSDASTLLGVAQIEEDENEGISSWLAQRIETIRKALGIDDDAVSEDILSSNNKDERTVHKLCFFMHYNVMEKSFGDYVTAIPYRIYRENEFWRFDYYNCENDEYCRDYVEAPFRIEILNEKAKIKPSSFDKKYRRQEAKRTYLKAHIKCFPDSVGSLREKLRQFAFVGTSTETFDDGESKLLEIEFKPKYIELIYEAVASEWLDAKIIDPPEVVEGMRCFLKDLLNFYNDNSIEWKDRYNDITLPAVEDKLGYEENEKEHTMKKR